MSAIDSTNLVQSSGRVVSSFLSLIQSCAGIRPVVSTLGNSDLNASSGVSDA